MSWVCASLSGDCRKSPQGGHMSYLYTFRKSLWSDAKRAARVLGATTMALLLVCLPLFSQGSQGAIRGAVVDPSGGVIAEAMVTVTDPARGITKSLVTDSAG